jgi:uncharacterized protein (TIGR00730 family)
MGHKKEEISLIQQQTTQIMSEMMLAAETLANIGPAISLFGSARIQPDSEHYQKSEKIAQLLAKAGFTIIAGGGPGIMEAANKGAFEAGGTSVGLHIKLRHEAKANPFLSIELPFKHFVSRKSTFFMHSLAYVVLPGGFGTLDELFEALTLMQTGKVPQGPVILVGTIFWSGLMTWIQEQLAGNELINKIDPNSFFIADEPEQIVTHFLDFYKDHPDILKLQPNRAV